MPDFKNATDPRTHLNSLSDVFSFLSNILLQSTKSFQESTRLQMFPLIRFNVMRSLLFHICVISIFLQWHYPSIIQCYAFLCCHYWQSGYRSSPAICKLHFILFHIYHISYQYFIFHIIPCISYQYFIISYFISIFLKDIISTHLMFESNLSEGPFWEIKKVVHWFGLIWIYLTQAFS